MRDPSWRPRSGMSLKTKVQLYLVAIVVLLCAGALLGRYLYDLLFSFEFLLFAVIAVVVLLVIAWVALSVGTRRRRRW